MRYEWDPRKNRLNERKHGISFELAVLAFDDENYILTEDRVDEAGEQRWRAIGYVSLGSGTGDVMTVAHVYREEENGEEIPPHHLRAVG